MDLGKVISDAWEMVSTVFYVVGEYFINNIWPAVTSALFVSILLALIAAYITYRFALKSQNRQLKNEINADIYRDLRTARREFSEAATAYTVHLKGYSSRMVAINSTAQSRDLLKGITDKKDYEYDADMRSQWSNYCEESGRLSDEVARTFIQLHYIFEETIFVYPKLQAPFLLLRDEYNKWFNMSLKVMSFLYSQDPIVMLDEKEQEKVQSALDDYKFDSIGMNLVVFNDDLFKLMQEDLIARLYKYKPVERIPLDGSQVITRSGFKSYPIQPGYEGEKNESEAENKKGSE